MDHKLRIVVEAVSCKTGKVVNRKILETLDVKKPETIFELGLRHTEQVKLLQLIQDSLLDEQSVFLSEDIQNCPRYGRKLAKHGFKKSDFHAVFTDHKIPVQRLTCCNKECNWKSVPSVKSLFGTSIHPDLAKIQSEISALHSFREAQEILKKLSNQYRKINNHDRLNHISECVGNELAKLHEQPIDESTILSDANELIVQIDGGHIKNKDQDSRSFEALSAVIYRPENVKMASKNKATITDKQCVASAKDDKQKTMRRYVLNAAKKQGLSEKTKVTVLSDGAKNCWNSLALLKNECAQYIGILDWFHIGMKFENIMGALPIEHYETIDHVKWRLWHGDIEVALHRLKELCSVLAEEKQKNRVHDLYHYLNNNKSYIINYSDRKKQGLVFTSQVAESNIESLINKRFKKLNKMQWTREGAHSILQIRSAMISQDWLHVWVSAVSQALQIAA